MGKVEQDRRASGREFQMDGAVKENERRPFADRISGTMRRSSSRVLKFVGYRRRRRSPSLPRMTRLVIHVLCVRE